MTSGGEMDGQELNRKYFALKGYEFWDNPTLITRSLMRLPQEIEWQDVPRLDLDANLAIAEADLVFDGHWSLDRLGNKFAAWSKETLISAEGATFSEAILKALIAAKEQAGSR
jgi:hypothetical protein